MNKDIIALYELGYNLIATSLKRAYEEGLISWLEVMDFFCQTQPRFPE